MRFSKNPWFGILKEASLLTYIEVKDDRPDYSSSISKIRGVHSIIKDGVWTKFTFINNGKEYIISYFCKRLIISQKKESIKANGQELNEIISIGIELKKSLVNVANKLAKDIAKESYKKLHYYLILWCDYPPFWRHLKKTNNNEYKGWIDDGMTSFFIRIYDSTKKRLGYIRISRHIGICYSLNEKLRQEIANAIIEKFFYTKGKIDSEKVFNLFDALSRYILPTELTLFLQNIIIKLTIIAILVAIGISLGSAICDNSIKCIFVFYILAVISIIIIWYILSKIHNIFYR